MGKDVKATRVKYSLRRRTKKRRGEKKFQKVAGQNAEFILLAAQPSEKSCMENGETLRLWFSAVQTNKKTKNSDCDKLFVRPGEAR